MTNFYKNLAIWLVLSLVLILIFNIMTSKKEIPSNYIKFSEFIDKVEKGIVPTVLIQGMVVSGQYKNNEGKNIQFKTLKPLFDADLTKRLLDKKVQIEVKKEEEKISFMSLLFSFLPFILMIGIWIFFMRQMSPGGGKNMSFGKSKAKLLTEVQEKVTFEDVAGIDESKVELEEIIDFLKEPKKFSKLGGKVPKGVLLSGFPGTGKTLLARAVAGEAGVPFFSTSGSDFVEMFVGVGSSRVRDLFQQGKKHAPCIIFIDEIDAIGRHRGAGIGGGHDEREQTLNQLLVEMDGFESNNGVIIIAATNRPDVLDPALLRPGRFDRQVVVPRPDVKGREQILKVHTKKVPLSEEVQLESIAKGTPGFSGADLANIVNEAALLAARTGKEAVDSSDFEMAKDKVIMGIERRSMVISDSEKKNTAYHEAGHAIVAKLTYGADPVHKVSIIPRGRALGVTMQLPTEDKHSYSRECLNAKLAVLMGGRAAEKIIFNTFTTGAGNDIERATDMARKMVCEWGMSETFGPVSFGKNDGSIFLGRDMASHKNFSEKTAELIDEEIRKIVNESYVNAVDTLTKNIDILHSMSNMLLEKETINATEVNSLF